MMWKWLLFIQRAEDVEMIHCSPQNPLFSCFSSSPHFIVHLFSLVCLDLPFL